MGLNLSLQLLPAQLSVIQLSVISEERQQGASEQAAEMAVILASHLLPITTTPDSRLPLMIVSLSIQPISSSVLPGVLELDNLCFGKLWTLEAYQRELDSPNSELLGLFLQKNQVKENTYDLQLTTYDLLAIGCFWAILDEAHITLLAVHPNYQGQGLGQAMLWGLMQAARDRALERATLEVRASNQPAISLYSKFGFQLAGRRRRYYKDTNEDALILWRSGLQQPEFQVELTNWYKIASDRLDNLGIKLQAIASAIGE